MTNPCDYYVTSHEADVLKMLGGQREGEWGAWVSACLESLQGMGLCTPGPHYKITDAGRDILAALPADE